MSTPKANAILGTPTGEHQDILNAPPDRFLGRLLALQCRHPAVSAGAVLRLHGPGSADVLSVFPTVGNPEAPPPWLTQAVAEVSKVAPDIGSQTLPLRGPAELYGQPAGRHLVVVRLAQGAELAAFVVEARPGAALHAVQEKLELTAGIFELYRLRQAVNNRQADLERLSAGMAILAALNDADRYHGACMTLVNELSSRFDARRVSLGFVKDREVRLAATSHTEKFSRKMQEVQQIEAAMEECFDQDLEVTWPAPENAEFVYRVTEDLARKQGPSAVVSLPLRRDGAPVGVITLEREPEKPFETSEVEVLRLTCDLCTARLMDLKKHDRWFGARLAADCRQAFAHLVGPKHTWMKLVALGVFAAVLFLILARGQYRAEATVVLEPDRQRVVSSPFGGFLESVEVKPGDSVTAGQELARLETVSIEGDLATAENQLEVHRNEARAARRDEKPAEAQIAEARAAQVQAQIDLLKYRLGKAVIKSPIDGVVLEGDLERSVERKLDAGEVLFRVAPLGTKALRATVLLPEDQVADLIEQMEKKEALGEEVRGTITLAADPASSIPIVVERVDPVAQVVKGRNAFRVVARLETDDATLSKILRPGMEGVSHIDLGRARYAWIWTRRLSNWIQMKLWW